MLKFPEPLKGSTDAETEDALLFVKIDGNAVQHGRAHPRIWIICINQTERHVDDRHLDTKLYAQTRPVVCKSRECAVAKTSDRIGLGFAAQKDALESDGQIGKRINR